jgi:hypothetical protein
MQFPICVLCSAEGSGFEQAADISQGSPKKPAKNCCPQTRTLICWASKYFDGWLAREDKLDLENYFRIYSRGWKSGTIQQFFEIKDRIFKEEYLDCDNPALGE